MILDDYEALKCRYPSKKCWNQRAVKRNGERHNLCEMHRQKANNNQRRLDKKRKAGHLMKGPGAENDSPEGDYLHHAQHMPHSHSHQDHYEHQAEKRMRVRLTDMYVAAQSLSSPHHPHHHMPHMPTHHHHSSIRERELAPLLPTPVSSSASRHSPLRPQMLHLPPLTSHIPLIKKSFLKTENSSPTLSKVSSTPSAAAVKPTILLPPITSVPRCSQYPLVAGGSGVSSTNGSPHDASWHFRRYGKEEQINSA